MIFLLLVVVASAIGIALVVLRSRRPTSMDASISEFERSLRAIAPDDGVPRRRVGGSDADGPDHDTGAWRSGS